MATHGDLLAPPGSLAAPPPIQPTLSPPSSAVALPLSSTRVSSSQTPATHNHSDPIHSPTANYNALTTQESTPTNRYGINSEGDDNTLFDGAYERCDESGDPIPLPAHMNPKMRILYMSTDFDHIISSIATPSFHQISRFLFGSKMSPSVTSHMGILYIFLFVMVIFCSCTAPFLYHRPGSRAYSRLISDEYTFGFTTYQDSRALNEWLTHYIHYDYSGSNIPPIRPDGYTPVDHPQNASPLTNETLFHHSTSHLPYITFPTPAFTTRFMTGEHTVPSHKNTSSQNLHPNSVIETTDVTLTGQNLTENNSYDYYHDRTFFLFKPTYTFAQYAIPAMLFLESIVTFNYYSFFNAFVFDVLRLTYLDKFLPTIIMDSLKNFLPLTTDIVNSSYKTNVSQSKTVLAQILSHPAVYSIIVLIFLTVFLLTFLHITYESHLAQYPHFLTFHATVFIAIHAAWVLTYKYYIYTSLLLRIYTILMPFLFILYYQLLNVAFSTFPDMTIVYKSLPTNLVVIIVHFLFIASSWLLAPDLIRSDWITVGVVWVGVPLFTLYYYISALQQTYFAIKKQQNDYIMLNYHSADTSPQSTATSPRTIQKKSYPPPEDVFPIPPASLALQRMTHSALIAIPTTIVLLLSHSMGVSHIYVLLFFSTFCSFLTTFDLVSPRVPVRRTRIPQWFLDLGMDPQEMFGLVPGKYRIVPDGHPHDLRLKPNMVMLRERRIEMGILSPDAPSVEDFEAKKKMRFQHFMLNRGNQRDPAPPLRSSNTQTSLDDFGKQEDPHKHKYKTKDGSVYTQLQNTPSGGSSDPFASDISDIDSLSNDQYSSYTNAPYPSPAPYPPTGANDARRHVVFSDSNEVSHLSSASDDGEDENDDDDADETSSEDEMLEYLALNKVNNCLVSIDDDRPDPRSHGTAQNKEQSICLCTKFTSFAYLILFVTLSLLITSGRFGLLKPYYDTNYDALPPSYAINPEIEQALDNIYTEQRIYNGWANLASGCFGRSTSITPTMRAGSVFGNSNTALTYDNHSDGEDDHGFIDLLSAENNFVAINTLQMTSIKKPLQLNMNSLNIARHDVELTALTQLFYANLGIIDNSTAVNSYNTIHDVSTYDDIVQTVHLSLLPSKKHNTFKIQSSDLVEPVQPGPIPSQPGIGKDYSSSTDDMTNPTNPDAVDVSQRNDLAIPQTMNILYHITNPKSKQHYTQNDIQQYNSLTPESMTSNPILANLEIDGMISLSIPYNLLYSLYQSNLDTETILPIKLPKQAKWHSFSSIGSVDELFIKCTIPPPIDHTQDKNERIIFIPVYLSSYLSCQNYITQVVTINAPLKDLIECSKYTNPPKSPPSESSSQPTRFLQQQDHDEPVLNDSLVVLNPNSNQHDFDVDGAPITYTENMPHIWLSNKPVRHSINFILSHFDEIAHVRTPNLPKPLTNAVHGANQYFSNALFISWTILICVLVGIPMFVLFSTPRFKYHD